MTSCRVCPSDRDSLVRLLAGFVAIPSDSFELADQIIDQWLPIATKAIVAARLRDAYSELAGLLRGPEGHPETDEHLLAARDVLKTIITAETVDDLPWGPWTHNPEETRKDAYDDHP